MDEKRNVELINCPHCGARRPNNAERCWLCGVYRTDPPGTVAPFRSAQPARAALGGGNVAALLAGLLVALVAIGVFEQQPGLAILLLVFVAPALIALGVTMGREGPQAPSFGGVFAGLMFSVIGVLLMLGLVVMAAVAALLAFCSLMLQGIGPH